MDTERWIFMISFVCVLKATHAVYCEYKTTTGMTQDTFCMEICCEGPDITFENVCCRIHYEKHLYTGAGMAGILLILSLTCICCKIRYSKQRRQSTSTATTNEQLPTVSFHVQPPQPPPYIDADPPPYFLQEPGTTVKEEEQGTSVKAEIKFTIPEDPPPPYFPYDTTS